jgi:type I restriction enzyme S subunit
MNPDWPIYKVSEFAEIYNGGTPSTSEPKNFGGEIPWITPKDLSNYEYRYISKGARSITEHGLKNSSATIVPEGTILLTSRAPVGYMAIAQNPVTTNQGFKNLVIKEGFDNRFIFYMLKFNVDFLKSQASGSTFAELSRTTLKEITFSIPPLPEQRAIAEVLSALDDKIELNRRMNQTLEQLARAIYKHMFIDNPEREGWEVKSLSELAEFVKGVSYSSSDLVEDSNIALVTLKSFNRGGGYKEEGLKPFVGFFKPQQRIFPGEVVVAHTDLTQMAEVIGRSARVEENEVHTTLVASLDLVIVRPKQLGITNEYIYCLLAYGDFSDFAYGYTNGTTVLHLSKKALEEYKVFAPPSTFLITFSEKVTPLFKQIDLNNKQSRTLAKLRDTLLPKLMSGQVIINEVNT